jgi:exopolysaccharide biosynthesis polyprenyl glycosylphosphotransferase
VSTKSDNKTKKRTITVASADGAVEPYDALLNTSSVARPPESRRSEWLHILVSCVQLGLDTVAIALGFALAHWLRRRIEIGGAFVDFRPEHHLLILGLSTVSVLVAFHFMKLYHLARGYSRIDELFRLIAATGLGLVLAVFLNSFALGPAFLYSRITLFYAFVLVVLFTFSARFAFSIAIDFLRRRGAAEVRVLVVGNGEPAARILRRVQASPQLGYRALGVVCSERDPQHLCDAATLGHVADLPDLVRKLRADELIVTVSGASQDELINLVSLCDDLPVNIRIYPDAFQLITTTEVSINALTGLPLVSVKDVRLRGVNRVIKRAMDIVFSAAFIIVVSPLMLAIALLIKLTDPSGPVFYTQTRVGVDGRRFQVLKFRSMRVVRDHEPGWTVQNDPRRTRLGRFIRRFSLDEMPQFINVLMGDMSIVGPRPEQPVFVEQFSQTIPRYMRRHKEKAGITGWAQVNGLRGDTSIEERTRYDLYYVENWSVLFDLKIMLKTALVIFADKNAY